MTPANQAATTPTIMTVRAREDGHWYVGSGRSIANGPYRRPEHLIGVVSDLMGDNTHWRIEVLNASDALIATYDAGSQQSMITANRNAADPWKVIG